jgi:hypothetical protein
MVFIMSPSPSKGTNVIMMMLDQFNKMAQRMLPCSIRCMEGFLDV